MRFLTKLALPCLALNALTALAVFKDDAYHTDWHVALAGPSLADSTFFHRPSEDTKASLIYSLTTRDVLAAVNPKDGELVWRQQLTGGTQGTDGIARAGSGVVVTAVGKGLSSFDAASGRLVWDADFRAPILDLAVTGDSSVAVLFADGTVRLLAGGSEETVWEWKELPRCVSIAGRARGLC